MKNLILLMLFCIISAHSFSQNTLSGIITNTKGEPLAGANIVLENTKFGMSTKSDGSYVFKNVKNGNYKVSVSFIGYAAYSNEFSITGNLNLPIVLDAKNQITDEVIVSAIRAGDKSPVAKTNITKDVLKSRNAADDIPIMLSLTPSVVSTTESGIGIGNTNMRIRGTDATRINITVNGIPLNDPESQGVYWVNMPDFSSSVEEVQIQRGVGTSTNGAAAFGATVNFNTTSYHAEPLAEISTTMGSFNTYKYGINASTGLIKDKYSFDVRYTDLQSDGYIRHAFSDHRSLYMSGTMKLNNGLVKANIIHGDQRTGISWWGIDQETLENDRRYNPAGVYTDENGEEQYYEDQTDNYIQTHYQLFYSANLNDNLHLNTAAFYTRGDGYYEQYKEDEAYADYGLPNVTLPDGSELSNTDLIRQKWLANDFYGFTASLLYNTSRANFTLGGGWNRFDGDHFGEVIWQRYAGASEKGDQWYFNNSIKTDGNIFAKVDYSLTDQLNIYADMQYRGINYTMKGSDDDLSSLNQAHNYNFFNPKAGIFYTFNKQNQAYASYAVANREPSRANFKDANGDLNATPQSERLNDLEIGYQYKSPKFASNVNFYYMQYKDQLVPTGEKSDVGYDIMTNVDDSYRTGLEIEVGVKILPYLRWDGNTTLSMNKIKEFTETATLVVEDDWSVVKDTLIQHKNSTIAYSPSVTANSIFTIEPIKGNSIKIISQYVGEQYFDNTESEINKLDDYLIWNAVVTQQFKPSWMDLIEVQLTVNNIFNHLYSSNAYSWGQNYYQNGEMGSWNYYYPQAGTHFYARVRLMF
ncbi:TonB-dependent receptor [Saccharicrinis aurantiacus]|uniref:TonB-dependent receptor n=1 Tax=Saccharicrinis aurantiacus TaxID=1849719 RepID=UPI000837F714|nr:TonB-dependent receptor [Saccharicrinis aurantiacus]